MKKIFLCITSLILATTFLVGCTQANINATTTAKNLKHNLNILSNTVSKMDTIDNEYIASPDLLPTENINLMTNENTPPIKALAIQSCKPINSMNDIDCLVPQVECDDDECKIELNKTEKNKPIEMVDSFDNQSNSKIEKISTTDDKINDLLKQAIINKLLSNKNGQCRMCGEQFTCNSNNSCSNCNNTALCDNAGNCSSCGKKLTINNYGKCSSCKSTAIANTSCASNIEDKIKAISNKNFEDKINIDPSDIVNISDQTNINNEISILPINVLDESNKEVIDSIDDMSSDNSKVENKLEQNKTSQNNKDKKEFNSEINTTEKQENKNANNIVKTTQAEKQTNNTKNISTKIVTDDITNNDKINNIKNKANSTVNTTEKTETSDKTDIDTSATNQDNEEKDYFDNQNKEFGYIYYKHGNFSPEILHYNMRFVNNLDESEAKNQIDAYLTKIQKLYAMSSDVLSANNQLLQNKALVLANIDEANELNENILNGNCTPSTQQILALNNYIKDIKNTINRLRSSNGQLTSELNSINNSSYDGIVAGVDVINSNYIRILNHLDTRITYHENALATLEQIKYLLQDAVNNTSTDNIENEINNQGNNQVIESNKQDTNNNNTSTTEVTQNESNNSTTKIDNDKNITTKTQQTKTEDTSKLDVSSIKNIDTYKTSWLKNIDTYNAPNFSFWKRKNQPNNTDPITNDTNNELIDDNAFINNSNNNLAYNQNGIQNQENANIAIPNRQNELYYNQNLNNFNNKGLNYNNNTSIVPNNFVNSNNNYFDYQNDNHNGVINENNVNDDMSSGAYMYDNDGQLINSTNNYGTNNINNTNFGRNNINTYKYNSLIDALNRGTVANGINKF